MIMAVNPFEEPANGPNWFPFDPQILYEIHVDNDQDGRDDVVFQIRFSTQYQLPTVPTHWQDSRLPRAVPPREFLPKSPTSPTLA
jgi:hypothetical protein